MMRLFWSTASRVGLVCLVSLTASCLDGAQDRANPVEAETPDDDPSNNDPANNAPSNNDPANNDPANNDPLGGLTYHRDIRPLFEVHCGGCHEAGGIGPFTLDYDPQEWATGPAWWVQPAAAAIEDGTMPPWQPADGCRDIQDTRQMTEAEKATVSQWASEGFVQGDPADHEPPSLPDALDLPPHDLTLDAGVAYTPDQSRPDDYRCLLLDHTFEAETFVTGTQVIPGDPNTVHHVLIYRIDPEDVPEAIERENSTPEPGYTCFGGTGSSGGGPIAGWVPGSVPARYPEGSAIILGAGTRLVMQVHYNTLGGEIGPDKTQLGMWVLPSGQRPQRQVSIVGFADPSIRIAAGDPQSEHTNERALVAGARIIGAAPHMHTLGTAIHSELLHDSGETSCVVDVPEWDFNWQQFYLFEPEDFILTQQGDRHRLTCVYDNSAANQPVINGEQVEPRDVRWGEGTLDEMCLNYLIFDVPYAPQPTEACEAFPGCVSQCGESNTGCYLACVQSSRPACATCLVQQTSACARRLCAEALDGVLACLDTCDEGLMPCLGGACLSAMDALYTCQRPQLLAGACNAELARCEATF